MLASNSYRDSIDKSRVLIGNGLRCIVQQRVGKAILDKLEHGCLFNAVSPSADSNYDHRIAGTHVVARYQEDIDSDSSSLDSEAGGSCSDSTSGETPYSRSSSSCSSEMRGLILELSRLSIGSPPASDCESESDATNAGENTLASGSGGSIERTRSFCSVQDFETKADKNGDEIYDWPVSESANRMDELDVIEVDESPSAELRSIHDQCDECGNNQSLIENPEANANYMDEDNYCFSHTTKRKTASCRTRIKQPITAGNANKKPSSDSFTGSDSSAEEHSRKPRRLRKILRNCQKLHGSKFRKRLWEFGVDLGRWKSKMDKRKAVREREKHKRMLKQRLCKIYALLTGARMHRYHVLFAELF